MDLAEQNRQLRDLVKRLQAFLPAEGETETGRCGICWQWPDEPHDQNEHQQIAHLKAEVLHALTDAG